MRGGCSFFVISFVIDYLGVPGVYTYPRYYIIAIRTSTLRRAKMLGSRDMTHRLALMPHVMRVKTVERMMEGFTLTKDGQVDPNELAKWVRQATRMGLTGEDAAKLAAYRLVYVMLCKFSF